MFDEQTVRIVKATAPVVAQNAEAITRRFYTIMFRDNPEVQQFFNPAHQYSGGQQRALAGAICAYAANIDNLGALGSAVELIAQKHVSLGVRPEHYPIVGKHLLVAIKDVLGNAATDEIIDGWRKAYGLLADIFIAREQQIYEGQLKAHGGWNGYRTFVVERKVPESDVVTSFYLRPADGQPIASFKAGQYITVRIDHVTTPTSPRNYSLSDRPGTGYYRISVKRESGLQAGAPGGLVSNYLHDNVQPGDTLEVGPPCGEFTLDPAHANELPIVLASGGIGITPVIAMLKTLVHYGVTTPVYFIHAAQNSRMHALADEVRSLAAKAPNVRTHVRYNAPLETDLHERRCDSVGLIDSKLLDEILPSSQPASFYFCGPKPFMTCFYDQLKRRGVGDSHIHVEFFGPKDNLSLEA